MEEIDPAMKTIKAKKLRKASAEHTPVINSNTYLNEMAQPALEKTNIKTGNLLCKHCFKKSPLGSHSKDIATY